MRQPHCPLCAKKIDHDGWSVTDSVVHCLECTPLAFHCEIGKLILQIKEVLPRFIEVKRGMVWWEPNTEAHARKTAAVHLHERRGIPLDPE